MTDYKHLHRSNQKQKPNAWESVAGGLLLGISVFGVMWYGLIQATGGF